MGWGSGADVMSQIIKRLKEKGFPDEVRENIYDSIIPALQSHDWDTELDCMGEDVAYDAALKKLHPKWFQGDP